jgi:hypothetical protein
MIAPFGIGAALVIAGIAVNRGYPWLGLLMILVGACVIVAAWLVFVRNRPKA